MILIGTPQTFIHFNEVSMQLLVLEIQAIAYS